MKILLVDNDRFILEVVKDLLRKAGHDVMTAQDGLSALDVLEGFVPDVIFLDMVMPNIDGKRLCRILRNMADFKDTFIVSLSATAEEDSNDIARTGVNASIPKGPINEMAEAILCVLREASGGSSNAPTQETERLSKVQQRGITRELLSAMRRFEIILEQMEEGVFEIASNGRIVYANRGACSLMGIPEEEMLGRYFPDLFLGENREQATSLLAGGAGAVVRTTYDQPLNLNGNQAVAEMHPIPGVEGKRIVILHNITDQKRAEEALRKSEERYRLLFENARDAIFVLQDDRIRFPNRRVYEILGFEEGRPKDIPFFDLVHPEDQETVIKRCREGMTGEGVAGVFPFRMVNPSNEEMWVEMNAVPINWEGRPAILIFMRDVTEKRRLETQFHQSQRMASIGTLAGGIAHEFNNLLMAIQANASLVAYGKNPLDPEYERLRNIETSVRKGADLVRQLLNFAREKTHRPETTDMNALMKRTEELFARTKKEISLHAHYQADLPMVEVDPAQMAQVLMSLYINAWQAMPKGGDVFLETRVSHLEGETAHSYGLEPGPYVEVSVRDTGTGMDRQTQERIFDPFFTTKDVGQGLGMGLAAAYGIVRNHGGIMDVSSEIGKGSTFRIYLPAATKRANAAGADNSGRGNLP